MSGPTIDLSARNLAISRRVSKLLDVDVSDAFRDILAHTAAVCPEVPSLLASTAGPLQSYQLAAAVRAPLEQCVLTQHDAMMARLNEVSASYQEVAATIKELEALTTTLSDAVAEASRQAAPLLSAVAVLREELAEIRARDAHVRDLLRRYDVSAKETELLQTGPIDEEFLRILLKVKGIHDSCRDMLVAEHQQAVVEIMESMYLLHVRAVERLAAYLVTKASETMTHDTPDLTDFFVNCVTATFDRPAQFARITHEVGRARRTALIRKFYDVLTRGVAGQRPLDALSGDPVRFFSELLTWMHQAIAEEDDLLRAFFPGASSVHHAPTGGAPPEDGPAKCGLLDHIFEPLCKHFRTRFDQLTERLVRQADHTPTAIMIAFFKLEGVLGFYATAFASLLGSTSALASAVEACKLDALRIFYNLLKVASSRMTSTAARGVARALTTTPEMEEVLRMLKAMLDAIASGSVPHAKCESEVAPVLSAIIDPLLSLTRGPLEAVPDPLARLVLRLNIFGKVESLLIRYSFTKKRCDQISEMLIADRDEYVAEGSKQILQRLGLSVPVKLVTPGCSLTAAQAQEVDAALKQFYLFVYNIGTITMPFYDHLSHAAQRAAIQGMIVNAICGAYAGVFRCIHDSVNPVSVKDGDILFLRATAQHSPEHISEMLGASTA